MRTVSERASDRCAPQGRKGEVSHGEGDLGGGLSGLPHGDTLAPEAVADGRMATQTAGSVSVVGALPALEEVGGQPPRFFLIRAIPRETVPEASSLKVNESLFEVRPEPTWPRLAIA